MPIDLGFADKQTLTTIPKNTVFLMEKIYLLKNRFGGEKRRPFSVKNKTKKDRRKRGVQFWDLSVAFNTVNTNLLCI